MSWDGSVIAGVDRVSPLTRVVEVITLRDWSSPGGGERRAPGRVTSTPVTAERPAGLDSAFEDWAASPSSIGTRKDVTVEILDRECREYRRDRGQIVGTGGAQANPGDS